MVHLSSTKLKEEAKMARNYKDYQYFANRPDVVKVWDDLDSYLDFCRFELREFNPADLYRKDSANYSAYLASKRPRRPYQGNKPRFEKRDFNRGQ